MSLFKAYHVSLKWKGKVGKPAGKIIQPRSYHGFRAVIGSSPSSLDSTAVAVNNVRGKTLRASDCLSLGGIFKPWVTMSYKRETSSPVTSVEPYGSKFPTRTHF